MRNIKRELFIFSASDINAMEEHFEEMARKGWMLDKIGEFSVKYKRIEPQELKFCIDMLSRLSAFDYPDKEDVLKYRNECREIGWKFIDSLHKFQVFYSDKEENLPPIQTDDRIKKSIINKSLWFEIIMLAICLPIFIWSLVKLFPFNYNILNSNISIAFTLIGPIFIIPTVNYVFSYIIWMLRASNAIKRGDSLPKTSYKHLRIKTLLLLYPLLLFILLFIIGLTLDLSNGNVTGLISILPTIIGLTVGTLFKRNKNRKKRSKGDNIGLFILVIVLMLIVVNIFMPVLRERNESQELIEGYKGLRLSDFELTSLDYSRFTRKGSIILPKYSTYYEISQGRGGPHIRTNYVRAINNKTAKYVFDGMIEESVTRYYRTLTSASEEYEYFDEAFYIIYGKDNKGGIILLKDDEVFYINSSLDLSNKDNIKIITNKLNNH